MSVMFEGNKDNLVKGLLMGFGIIIGIILLAIGLICCCCNPCSTKEKRMKAAKEQRAKAAKAANSLGLPPMSKPPKFENKRNLHFPHSPADDGRRLSDVSLRKNVPQRSLGPYGAPMARGKVFPGEIPKTPESGFSNNSYPSVTSESARFFDSRRGIPHLVSSD